MRYYAVIEADGEYGRARARLKKAASILLLALGCAPVEEDGRVHGLVVDAYSGAPVHGAMVSCKAARHSAATDERGAFIMELPAGRHTLEIRADGYLRGHRDGVSVRPGRRTEVELLAFRADPTDEEMDRWLAAGPERLAFPVEPDFPAGKNESGAAAEKEDGTIRSALAAPEIPPTIRVWRAYGTPLAPSAANNWADRSCEGRVEVLQFEEYVKGVVPHEWVPSWHREALFAGAVAARTYALSWVLRGGRWECADVDDGTVTQAYRDDRVFATDEAVEDTAGRVVVRADRVITTEYSAENGDPTADGVKEPLCKGATRHGHGRGMCQWGTQRWATSTCFRGEPCDFGEFGSDPKNHEWMVSHYWPGATIASAGPAEPCAVIGPEGGVLDDEGPCFAAYGPSEYWRVEQGRGYGSRLLWTNAFESDAPSNWARWKISLERPGRYRIKVKLDPDFGVWSAVRYTVETADGEETVVIDQGTGRDWAELGEFDLSGSGSVSLYDNYDPPVPPDQHIVADAVRIDPVEDRTDAGAPAGSDRVGGSDHVGDAEQGEDAGGRADSGSRQDGGREEDAGIAKDAARQADAAPPGGGGEGATGSCGCTAGETGGLSPAHFNAFMAFIILGACRRKGSK